MYAIELENPDAITLVVSDVDRSRRFYQDLLGLTAGSDTAAGSVLGGLNSGSSDLRLELRKQARGELVTSSMWLSVEVDSVGDVLDLYLLAIILGSKATLPRKRSDRWNTVVTDPDGHRISIWTHVPADTPGRDAGADVQGRQPLSPDSGLSCRWGADAARSPRGAGDTFEDRAAWVSGRGAGEADSERLNPSAGRDITPAN